MDNKTLKSIQEKLNLIATGFSKVPLGEFLPSKWQPPKGMVNERFTIENVPVEHLIPQNKKTNRVVFYLHGGAYVMGIMDSTREGAVRYSKAAGGAEVFYFDYRLSPKNCYPAALEDAIKIYKWILASGYDNNNIIFAGDSAGGNLTFALTLYLKDNNIPLPKAVIAYSPWANAANDLPSFKYNYEKDLFLGKYGCDTIRSQVNDPAYFDNADVKNDSYASPILGDYKGFPSLYLVAGAYELLLDDSKLIAKKAKKAGVKVKFKVYDEMPHDFPILFPDIEQSKEAWNEMTKFIKNNVKAKTVIEDVQAKEITEKAPIKEKAI